MDLSEMARLEAAAPPVVIPRSRSRQLRHRLADALEAELPGMQFVQVYGHEYTHTDDLVDYLCLPWLPTYVSCGAVSESAALPVTRARHLVHHVCALGKLGVVLGDGPRGWRELDLPLEVRERIVRWNDEGHLSFKQIAAELRNQGELP